MRAGLWLAGLLAVLATACASGGSAGPSDTPAPTPLPTVVASPTAAPTETSAAPIEEATDDASGDVACAEPSGSKPGPKVIALSDFTDAQAWDVDGTSILHAEEQCLVLVAAAAGDTVEAVPQIADLDIKASYGGQVTGLRTMALEVDAAPVAGTTGSFFGLVCGVDPRLRFYLGVGADSAVIAQANGDAIKTIAQEAAKPASDGATRLRAECDVGSFEAVFTLYADGKKLLSKKVGNLDILDRSSTFGRAGVVAGASDAATLTSFDDFTVHELAP